MRSWFRRINHRTMERTNPLPYVVQAPKVATPGSRTALRALAHAWRQWCELELVLDPDRADRFAHRSFGEFTSKDTPRDKEGWR